MQRYLPQNRHSSDASSRPGSAARLRIFGLGRFLAVVPSRDFQVCKSAMLGLTAGFGPGSVKMQRHEIFMGRVTISYFEKIV